MEGNVKSKMCEGIDNATCIAVFITDVYMDKVNGKNGAGDNCKLEFDYSGNRKTSEKMVSVVMEPSMRDTKEWEGPLGMLLGGVIYIDLCEITDAKLDELHGKIVKIVQKPLQKLFETFFKSVSASTNGAANDAADGDEPVMEEENGGDDDVEEEEEDVTADWPILARDGDIEEVIMCLEKGKDVNACDIVRLSFLVYEVIFLCRIIK